MSGSGQSAVSQSGDGEHTASCDNVNTRRKKLSRKQRLRPTGCRNYVHRTVVMHVTDRAAAARCNAALALRRYMTSASGEGGTSTPSSRVFTNLDSFLHSVTPVVHGKILSKANASMEGKLCPYFCLGDLWRAFEKWSAYGAGVPFLLNGTHLTTQYYVPYLSGMQVYTDSKKQPTTIGGLAEEKDVKSHEPDQQTNLVSDGSFASLNLNSQKLKQVTLSDNKTDVSGSCGTLVFEFMEPEGPYTRKPLSVQASILGSACPKLNKYRSCDLLPSSWICVAWYSSYRSCKMGRYPIYRIPVGPRQEELDACFLTVHPLSTQPGSGSRRLGSKNAFSSWVSLPAIGLVSYKLKGSMISPRDPYEREQEHSLMKDASNWLNRLQPLLPDYQFFVSRNQP